MTTLIRNFWQSLIGQSKPAPQATVMPVVQRPRLPPKPSHEIAPNDPLVAYFQNARGSVEVDRINLDSPAVRALKAAGVRMTVPLVSQGDLLGLLNLGPRLSEQDYSSDDRGLLNNLASQAAPALRVAQLVRQQQLELQARERLEQELRVARLIQQTLLPKELPSLPGWHVSAYYRPARAVGGDFYDFLYLPDGRLGLVVGDVTDKGVPAALVMATTRAILRSAAQRWDAPGRVLEQANDLLHPDIPPKMFVTCLYAILDPQNGRLRYANAGHDVPYCRSSSEVKELRATGMPLGLMPGMSYEEKEAILAPGESVLFYSDGLVEAHNPQRAMFSFPYLRTLVERHTGGATLIDFLLAELAEFTGANWEQEDDVTLVTLQRADTGQAATDSSQPGHAIRDKEWRTLAEFTLPSEAGNERLAMKEVTAAVQDLGLPPARLERLKTAVAEATMNAMEHGNQNRPELPVGIQLLASETVLAVRVTDQGGGQPIPDPHAPDLEAKLAGLQSPRGWGLFLIEKMVDEMHVIRDGGHHTLELIMYLGGDNNASAKL
ncbi:MAG: SpoIIE family protein phosphatase [Anaerolineae bacterium]|nr:SpoIIE family protein phosphatase [Anaerolineae bacterium]